MEAICVVDRGASTLQEENKLEKIFVSGLFF